MAKKTIWIVNQYNIPGVSRTRQTVLSQRLEEQDYEVYLLCGSTIHKTGEALLSRKEQYRLIESDGAKYYVIKTSTYHCSYKRVLVALQFQYKIWFYRSQFPKPDVIISDFAGLFGNIFLKWKKKYGTRVIYDVLDFWPEGFVDMGYIKRNSLIARYLYYLEHKSYREADGIIFSLPGGREYIIDKGWSKEVGGDVDTSNIGYLNNGVDLEVIDKQREEFILDDLDLDSDKFKVIYLGSISEFNGLDVLVETAKVLQDRGEEDIIILLYGYGNQEVRLKKLVADYGLKNIKFKGKVNKEYAMNLLTRGDINVFTFKDTPLLKYGVSPNKLFMYFASAKPVLSMIRPAHDLVEEKNAGVSVKNNPEIVADAIVRFSRIDKAEYERYCKNARSIAEEYDYKNLVKVLINQIEGVKE